NQYTNQQQTPFTHPQPHVQNQSIHNQYPSSPQEQQQRFTSQSTLQNPPVNPIVSTHYPQSVIPPSFHQPFGSVNNSLSSQYQMPPLSSQQQQQQQYQSASIPVPQTKFDPYRPQPVGAYEIPKLQPYQPQSNVLSTVQYPQHLQQQHQPLEQNINRISGMKPEDVYRSGVFLPTGARMPPPLSNNNGYSPQNEINQFVQYPSQHYSMQSQLQPGTNFYSNNNANFDVVLPSSSANVMSNMSNLTINSNQYSCVTKTNKNELMDSEFIIANDHVPLDIKKEISSALTSPLGPAEISQIIMILIQRVYNKHKIMASRQHISSCELNSRSTFSFFVLVMIKIMRICVCNSGACQSSR
ncbi:unnamed protein product, partial [Didymodactylos carnosus]